MPQVKSSKNKTAKKASVLKKSKSVSLKVNDSLLKEIKDKLNSLESRVSKNTELINKGDNELNKRVSKNTELIQKGDNELNKRVSDLESRVSKNTRLINTGDNELNKRISKLESKV